MLNEPLLRISRADLDKMMTTVEVVSADLSEVKVAAGSCIHIDRNNLPSIHYSIDGTGKLIVEGEEAIELAPHTLVLAPANKAIDIIAAGRFSRVDPVDDSIDSNIIITRPEHRELCRGRGSLSVLSGHFHAVYGAGLDLLGSLTTPIVEVFDGDDRLDGIMGYAVSELMANEIGGGSIALALFKLIILALLRRSLTSKKPWVECFSLLNDPPIARAFAEMAARPAAEFSVHALSRSVGLSRSAFMVRFAAAFGESPMSVLRRLRMRHAANLLAANALSIEQVALQAGYHSRSSFTRTFRKHFGTDPSDYRAGARSAELPGPYVLRDYGEASHSALSAG